MPPASLQNGEQNCFNRGRSDDDTKFLSTLCLLCAGCSVKLKQNTTKGHRGTAAYRLTVNEAFEGSILTREYELFFFSRSDYYTRRGVVLHHSIVNVT